MIARPKGTLGRLAYVARLGIGTHSTHQDVIALRASTVTVTGTEFWCSADGELYGPERHRSWRLEPAAYSMIVPTGDPTAD